MKVVPCGTQVILKVHGIKGVISEIMIKFEAVSYRVIYHDGTDLKDFWATEEEFEVGKHTKKKIGYHDS